MTIIDLPKPFIIADVGSNWKISSNESDNIAMAKRHIYDASVCGVNAVKFQLFTDEELYGMPGRDQWSLPKAWLPELAAYCAERSVEFMCTAFSPEGVFYVDPFVNIHKLASSEMKHVGMLDSLVRCGKPTLISNGGAHEDEVNAVAEYLYDRSGVPSDADFAFLQCVAAYPAQPADYNLRVLDATICVGHSEHDASYQLYAGVSDHTKSNVVALAAVGLGVSIFEKHFRAWPLYNTGPNTPDAGFSLDQREMRQYVEDIQEAFKALGDGKKTPRPSEQDMTLRYRRRLKVTKPIKEGEALAFGHNYGIYRSLTEDPIAGPPEAWKQFDGGVAKMNLEPGDPVWETTVERSTPK